MTWKAVAEAFGTTGTLPESQVEMNLRFPGQYWDGESEKHYKFYRDYSPIIGRYLKNDPVGLVGGVNFYAYAKINSGIFDDFLGLDSVLGGSEQ